MGVHINIFKGTTSNCSGYSEDKGKVPILNFSRGTSNLPITLKEPLISCGDHLCWGVGIKRDLDFRILGIKCQLLAVFQIPANAYSHILR